MLECSLITSYYDLVVFPRLMWLTAISQNQSKESFYLQISKITQAEGYHYSFSEPKSVFQVTFHE